LYSTSDVSIYDKFVELLVSKVKELEFGNGLDEKTSGGPVVGRMLLQCVVRSTSATGRSPKPNMIEFGRTSNRANKKVLK
jgi:acyl-CoA reductase-like NAD-dependent aldehyde dehydrogenase